MAAAGWHIQDGADAKGRRVIADRAYRAGDVVLEDDAAAWCLISEQLGAWCDCCLAPAAQPLRCSACKLAWYASREHQRRAWQAGAHRLECAALRSCVPHTPPTAVRLALRRYGEVLGLRHHWGDLQDAAKLECAQMGAAAHHLLQAAAPEAAEAVGPRELALLIARFGCNSHTISDDELQPLAVGIFPLGAMANHDCRPNTLHAFRGGRMVFRAVRAIQPGEEVTTSYTELAAPRWERRAVLLQHHLFDIDAPPGDGGAVAEAAAAEAAGLGAGSAAEAAPGAAAAGATGPSSTAAGATRSAEQQTAVQAALQCMPQQQPAAVVPLEVGRGVEVRLYACQQPPWPHDERDGDLAEVVLVGAGSKSGASWGGMWGSMQQAGSTSGGAAAGVGTESFGVEEELEGHLEVAGAGSLGSSSLSSTALAAGPASGAQQGAAVIHCWSGGLAEQRAAAEQLARRYAAALQLQQSLEGMLCDGRAEAAVGQLTQALQGLAGGTAGARLALGPRHVLRMRLLADLHRAALAAGLWEAALAAARQLLPLYKQAYQPIWPQLGLLWASAAKLEHLLERPAQALAAARAAAAILGATHGDGGAVVREMQRVVFEAQQELGREEAWGAAGAAEED
ncbi:hypothetical protein CHLNCDRAFT_137504 [Chlorella variabilis]|uniref:SET domain-containing protein n=1 Tax=Chlorella variabilis TaxID=554065 RepID=E1ZMK7_CHLVA|nr:hypothetical protein CHLNCDRAFT_137504 [Chlorella variabilis]EFN53133.1 hypothetical protein CHLNCDRAFT_137504 [Chlorella variabilis]|eukprot:XP_005845235.1 hypothetical protein CHLNCDRAFT_137504 [Chlorella variabilis]